MLAKLRALAVEFLKVFLHFVEGLEPCLEAGPVFFAILANIAAEGMDDKVF